MRPALRPTVAALAVGALLAACAPASDGARVSSSPSPTLWSPSPTAFPLSDLPSPSPSFVPADLLGGELTFGYSNFEGIPVGTSHAEFLASTGFLFDGCSTWGNNYYFPPDADRSALDWVLWAPSYGDEPDESDPSPSVDAWSIDYFALQPGFGVDTNAPFGPTGPGGVRLGMGETDVEIAFPDAAAHDYYFEYLDTTFREYVVAAPDDTAMVVSTVDGRVVDIRWGSPALAAGWDFMFCD